MPNPRLEASKKPGVCYALTPDGLELPVIDLTHPAFAEPTLSDAELHAKFAAFLVHNPLRRLPKFLRTVLYTRMMRGSLVGQIMLQARDTFVPGTSTYLMKLPPEILGAAYAQPMDRRIAQSVALVAMRLRLADMAHYLADALEWRQLGGALSASGRTLPGIKARTPSDQRERPGQKVASHPALLAHPTAPLQFIDIAGGPAADAWNALLLLHQRAPALLEHRPIAIDVFDQDEAGPAFGRAAVAALCAPGAPLAGLPIAFRHIPYDWRDTTPLHSALAARAPATITVASSEGGLFEYGDDAAIVANLTALAQAGNVLAVAGTFTSDDDLSRKMRQDRGAVTHPRPAAAFATLAAQSGWHMAKLREIPLSSRFLLTPTQP